MSHPLDASTSPAWQERVDSEVLPRAERRRFTAEDELHILQEAEACANGE